MRKTVFLIPRIKVQNANALSSPYTIGVPALTGFLGAVHALQRKLNQLVDEDGEIDYGALRFSSVGIVIHDFDLQTYRGRGDQVSSIIATSNPLDKDGNRPSFIEEARCHLTVSLVIEARGLDFDDHKTYVAALETALHSGLKIASGDIIDFGAPSIVKFNSRDPEDDEWRRLVRTLMPGYCLIERRDLMQNAMAAGDDALSALLDHLKVTWRAEQDDKGTIRWTGSRKTDGWIVPIATGFQGLTPLGPATNQRDPDTPHRFAEAVVTLGQFIMPYRLASLNEMLWHYDTELENDLYLCRAVTPLHNDKTKET